jgi:hypothetical protein
MSSVTLYNDQLMITIEKNNVIRTVQIIIKCKKNRETPNEEEGNYCRY